MNKFIKEIIKLKVLHDIESSVFVNAVSMRKSTFGEIVELNGKINCESNFFSNADIAYSLLSIFGLNTSKLNYQRMKSDCLIENSYLEFIATLRSIENDNPNNKRVLLNSKDLAPAGSAGAFIQQRQQNYQIVKKENEDIGENHCCKKNSNVSPSISSKDTKDTTTKKQCSHPNSQQRPPDSQPII